MSGKQDVIDLVGAGVDGPAFAGHKRCLDAAAGTQFRTDLAFNGGEDQGARRAAAAAGGFVEAAVEVLGEVEGSADGVGHGFG